jgi:type VI secretion system secreted protein VgrG
MRIPRRLLPVPALLALALAGCGGGGDDSTAAAPVETTETTALSKEELIAQGDGICAEVNAAVGTVGSTSSGAGGRAAQIAGLYGGMVERLKDLGAPSDDSAGYAEFIAAGEALAQAEDNVKLASEREEEGEALSEAEAEASSALDSFQSAATTFGFEDCAEAPAAPVPSGSVGEAAGEEAGGVEEEVEEATPEEEVAPEEGGAGVAEEESAGGGAGVGGGTEGGSAGGGGGSSGGVGPG